MILNNYPVRFTGNDGFKLLERYSYVNSGGTNYSGITSIWQVIVNCMRKINFNQYQLITNINLQTGVSSVNHEYFNTGCTFDPLDDYTVLHKLFIQNENYYDEDNKPQTCAEVLKSILKTFNLYLYQDCFTGYLYLLDDISYSVTGTTHQYFKKFTLTDYTLDDGGYEPMYWLGINTTNDYYVPIYIRNNTSSFEVVPGINSKKLNYSQYTKDGLLDYTSSSAEFTNLSGTTVKSNDANYGWSETSYTTSSIWNGYTGKTSFCKSVGTGTHNSGNTDYYCKMNENMFDAYTSDDTIFTLKSKMPYLNWESGKYRLKIEMNAYFRTKTRPDDNSQSGEDIRAGLIGLFIRVGDKQYINSGGYGPMWATGYDTFRYNLDFWSSSKKDSTMCDNWIGNSTFINKYKELVMGQTIPLTPSLYGDLVINVSNNVYGYNGDPSDPLADRTYLIKDVRFKNLKVSIVDEFGNTINMSDMIYEGKWDERYETKGSEIKMINGTNVNKLPYSKASILVDTSYQGTADTVYRYLQNVIKGRVDYDAVNDVLFIVNSGTTDLLENHYLKNILNQYSTTKYQLSITTSLLPFLNTTVDYPSYLPNKRFFITGLIVDYADLTNKIKLNEI